MEATDLYTAAQITRAAKAVASDCGNLWARVEQDEYRRQVRVVLAAAGAPEIVGASEAADMLCVATGNLGKLTGLPAPLHELRAGKFYPQVAVARLAKDRARRAAAVE